MTLLAWAASPVAACEVRTQTLRAVELTCAAPKDGRPGGARIDVRLDGFHDDSQASIALESGGQPVRCHPDDRTSLSGENGDEGEVRLVCRFDAASIARGAGGVIVRVDMHHAQFVGAVWVTDAGPPR